MSSGITFFTTWSNNLTAQQSLFPVTVVLLRGWQLVFFPCGVSVHHSVTSSDPAQSFSTGLNLNSTVRYTAILTPLDFTKKLILQHIPLQYMIDILAPSIATFF